MFQRGMWVLVVMLAVLSVISPGTALAQSPLVLNVPCDSLALVGAFTVASNRPGSETINLAAGCTYTPLVMLVLSPDGANGVVTVNGNGATISGDGVRRIMQVNADATLELDGVTLTGANSIANGGAIQNNGIVTLTNSAIANNEAFQGGGIYNTGTLTVARASFINNLTTTGAGDSIYNANSATITNTTFSAHVAGAIFNQGTMVVHYSTFFDNDYALENPGLLEISNSVIAGNRGSSSCYFPPIPGPNLIATNLYVDNNTCGNWTIVTLAELNLGPLVNNGGPTQTHALLAGSVLIDTATGDCPATDQRGVARPVGSACDVGAFELVPSASDAVPQRNLYNTATPTLTWSAISWAVNFEIQIDNDADFGSLAFSRDDLPENVLFLTIPALDDGVYYWRVRAKRANGVWGDWGRVDEFVIAAA